MIWFKRKTPWFFILSGFLTGTLVGLGLLIGFGILDIKSILPGLAEKSIPGGGALKVGLPAPDFELTDLSGKRVRLTDFRGRVVVLNFWATWCGPCRTEMPVFEEFYKQYAPDLMVLGINLEETSQEILGFSGPLGITYPILLDPEGLATRIYQVIQLPNTFFVDRLGIIQFRHIGLIYPDQFREYLVSLGAGE